MATYTPNYGLHQWVPEDQFRREDFNQDFLNMDTALGQVSRKMEANWNNLYNLLLQHDHEGKYTGWVQGMAFDSFTNDSKIESLSENMVLSKAGKFLFLNARTSASEDVNFGTTYKTTLEPGESLSETWTCNRMGWATALRLYMTGKGTLVITNGSNTFTRTEVKGSIGSTAEEVAFPWGLTLDPGETYTFRYTATTQSVIYRTGSTQFGYRVMLTYVPGEGNGVLVSTPHSLEQNRNRLMVWLRHSPCIEVTVLVQQGDTWLSVPFVESAMTYTLNGESCVQRQFVLEPLPSTFNKVSLRIEIQPIPMLPVQLYDYGVAIL